MTLNIDDLGMAWEALFDARAKAYNIGLMLKVSVGTLNSIRKQYSDPSDQLRETLQAWLETATQRKWETIVKTLSSPTIGEAKLAGDIETKYCQDTPGQATCTASGQMMRGDTSIQQEITELKQQMQNIKLEMAAQPQPNPEGTLKKLTWRKSPKAPEAMYRGSAATDGTMAYFNSWGSTRVHQYYSDSHQWNQLPDLPHAESTLVMADSKLTSVGGYTRGEAFNTLFSLTGEGSDEKWLQHFPPMRNKRFFAAAICSDRTFIVAGGDDERNELTSVEVLNIDTQQWSTACSLPYAIDETTISICGERLYMLGGYNPTGPTSGETRSVLTCSIRELLHSCQRPSLAGKPSSLSKSTIWQYVADAPYKRSSCTTLHGRLVAVGGIDEAGKETTSISAYDENTDSWQAMEAMKTPRSTALVASFHDNTMIVVGGRIGGIIATVEIAQAL